MISSAEEEGGVILLDGRGVKVPAYPNGNFIGATVIEASVTMRCYQWVEIFGSQFMYNQDEIERRFSDPFSLSSELILWMKALALSTRTGMATEQRYSPSLVHAPVNSSMMSMSAKLASMYPYLYPFRCSHGAVTRYVHETPQDLGDIQSFSIHRLAS